MNKTVTHLWTIALGSVLSTTLPKLDIKIQKGGEKYIMTSSKQASDKVLEPLATGSSK